MNKNWLYRVLALALVAMLALPMFALAEDVLPEQAEEVVEAGELTLGEDEAVAKDRYSDLTTADIYVNLAYSDPNREITLTAGNRHQILVDGVGATRNVKFKSSNKKVAQVNSEGVLTAIDVGTAKITVSGKTEYTKKKLKMTFTVKVKDNYRAAGVAGVFDGSDRVGAKNTNMAANVVGGVDGGFAKRELKSKKSGQSIIGNLWAEAVIANNQPVGLTGMPLTNNPSYTDIGLSGVLLNGTTIHFLPGEGWHMYYDNDNRVLVGYDAVTDTYLNGGLGSQLYFDVMAFNKDGIYLDGIDDPSEVSGVSDTQYTYDRDYNWKITSGKDYVFVDNAYRGSKKNFDYYQPVQSVVRTAAGAFNYSTEPALHMIFFKPGKATMNVTTANYSGNKTSSTKFHFVVDKNEKTFYKPTKDDLKTAIANDTLYYGVQSIAVKDMGNVEVTLFFVNGTDFSVTTLKDFEFQLSSGLLPSANGTEYPDYSAVSVASLNAASIPFVGTLSKRTVKASIKRHETTTVKLTFKSSFDWYSGIANSYQFKSTTRNEVFEPFQMLNNPRYFYVIDKLNFKLAAGFYRTQSYNITTGYVPNVNYFAPDKNIVVPDTKY